MVRARHMIIWTGQDYPTGNSSRRKMKRQTEETMERQHQRVDWPWMEHHTTGSWEPWGVGVGEAGCKIYSGAPMVSQTMGLVRWGKEEDYGIGEVRWGEVRRKTMGHVRWGEEEDYGIGEVRWGEEEDYGIGEVRWGGRLWDRWGEVR